MFKLLVLIFVINFYHRNNIFKDIFKSLNTKKACPEGDMPVKLIKMNEDTFSRLIFENFNQSLVNSEFSHCLKQAKVISVFKN